MGHLCRNQIFAVMKPAVLSHARINGAIVHGPNRATSQGIIARAWFRVATVLWCLAFGIWYALYVAWGEAAQDEIRREHGDGEQR
jgi:hypothetical protein